MERYDIAIIGSGPAGVSAAITAKIRNKNIILFGRADLSSKIKKASRILNYPGLPNVTGEELVNALSEHLKSLDIPVTEKKVGSVYAMGDYFAMQADEDIVEAKSVILAAGVASNNTIKGEEEFLGRGVSCCATCDGALYRGKNIIVIGYGKSQEAEALYLSELAGQISYIPVYKQDTQLPEKVRIIRQTPDEIYGQMTVKGLKTREGNDLAADGIFVLRESLPPRQLVPGIKTIENRVEVNISMETNIPGLFACGDIAGEPYQYIKAAGQGNTAALSAVKFLSRQGGQL